jgi:hypothetical protein
MADPPAQERALRYWRANGAFVSCRRARIVARLLANSLDAPRVRCFINLASGNR